MVVYKIRRRRGNFGYLSDNWKDKVYEFTDEQPIPEFIDE